MAWAISSSWFQMLLLRNFVLVLHFGHAYGSWACSWGGCLPNARSSEDQLCVFWLIREAASCASPAILPWTLFSCFFGLYSVPICTQLSKSAKDSGVTFWKHKDTFLFSVLLLQLYPPRAQQAALHPFNSGRERSCLWDPPSCLVVWKHFWLAKLGRLFISLPSSLIILLCQLSSFWQLLFHDILPSFFNCLRWEVQSGPCYYSVFALEHNFEGYLF